MVTTSPTPATTMPTEVGAVTERHARPGTPPSRQARSTGTPRAPADPLARRRTAARKLYLGALDTWLTARSDEEQDQARRVLDEALDLMGVPAPAERRRVQAASSAAGLRRACATRR